MIINHNLEELKKKLEHLSTLERISFLEDLERKEPKNREMEQRLEYHNKERLKRVVPKRFCPFNEISEKDVVGDY